MTRLDPSIRAMWIERQTSALLALRSEPIPEDHCDTPSGDFDYLESLLPAIFDTGLHGAETGGPKLDAMGGAGFFFETNGKSAWVCASGERLFSSMTNHEATDDGCTVVSTSTRSVGDVLSATARFLRVNHDPT